MRVKPCYACMLATPDTRILWPPLFTWLSRSLPIAYQYQSKSLKHWIEIPPNVHNWEELISNDWYWSALGSIPQFWSVLIGIYWHWAMIEGVLFLASFFFFSSFFSILEPCTNISYICFAKILQQFHLFIYLWGGGFFRPGKPLSTIISIFSYYFKQQIASIPNKIIPLLASQLYVLNEIVAKFTQSRYIWFVHYEKMNKKNTTFSCKGNPMYSKVLSSNVNTLRIPDTYESKIVKICNFLTF